MQKDIEVSVIIVHYGHGGEVFKCLDNFKTIQKKFKKAEFILVDNNEEKVEKSKIKKNYPWVTYLQTPKNLGWGGGRNFGIKKSTGEYIFSLDSDILIDYKSFTHVYETIKKNKNIGIVSPRLKNISGKIHPEATNELTPLRGILFLSFINKLYPNNPISNKYVMSDWNRKTSRYVDAPQFGAFIMRRTAYDEIGGFDEKLFLYFEENDVSNSLHKKGWKTYFDAKSEATHLESKGTPKNSDTIKKIFSASRFHYFKKHYGIIPALLVESITRLSKNTLIMIAILALGTFLRFYKLQQNISYNGEVGYDYITIRTFVENHQIPLIGPRTSHEWFFIGPMFYWIFCLLMPIFNYSVFFGAYFFAIIGVATILVCYLTVKSLFGQKAGIISSFLLSFSFLWVQLTHDARFNGVTGLLFFPFYYYLVKATKDSGKSIITLGVILGIMFSFFPSPILLLPGAMVVIFIYRKKINSKYFIPGILGFIIPNIPYIIYNAEHNFEILRNLFVWIPYRILGFLGFYPKNTATPQIVQSNFGGLYTFFQQSFLQNNNLLIFILIASVVIFTIAQIKKNLPLQVLIILSVVSYVGLFLHGDPPPHYYLVIYPVPIILLSLMLEKISIKYVWLSVLIVGYLLIFNLKFFFSDKWFYVDPVRMSKDMIYVPYTLQEKIVNYIVGDVGNNKFSLVRVGPNDNFGESFSLNYQYLLWNEGHKPDQSSKLVYTIYEDTSNLPQNQKIVWIENIAISKNEK